jgi:hypothetical protein
MTEPLTRIEQEWADAPVSADLAHAQSDILTLLARLREVQEDLERTSAKLREAEAERDAMRASVEMAVHERKRASQAEKERDDWKNTASVERDRHLELFDDLEKSEADRDAWAKSCEESDAEADAASKSRPQRGSCATSCGQVLPRVPARPGGRPLPALQAQAAHAELVPRLRIVPRQARPLLRRPRAARLRAAGRHRAASRSSSTTSGASAPAAPTTRTSRSPRDFFKWAGATREAPRRPHLPIEKARKRGVHREIFNPDQRARSSPPDDPRDRLALRLLLDYGLRKGALQAVQFQHFDHYRAR